MNHPPDDVDGLLRARAEIDEQLRRHKSALTVLFTDIVGSTGFFERNGDTAGLAMLHRHDKLASSLVEQNGGRIIKTIGDSAMAEFSDATSAVRAAVQIQRQFLKLNLSLAESQRVEIRIGIHSGVGYRKGNDLFGDVVNVAARVVKRTAPAQILLSRSVYDSVSQESDLDCQWFNKFTIDGRAEKEDVYEVKWTNEEAYREVRDRVTGSSGIPSRFELLSQVGSGGSGVVYKVRDVGTDEIVAIKILKPEIASDPAVQENFKRELRLSRKITHKNVCRIFDFCRTDGMTYASMEFIEGESLLARLNRAGRLPLNEAVDIARQICAGLREAHAQGIVHRDLKPANIMLDRSGTVKIMDFGVARLVESNGPMTGTIVGTPSYMAPEQAELKPVSARTDIYALGLVLYEMVTGVAAFSGDTPVAVALMQIREYPRRPREIFPDVSRPVEAVVWKCIQKDSGKRYQSAEELEIALHRAARARPVPAWQATLDRRLRKAELHARQLLQRGVEEAAAFLKRQQSRIPAPLKVRKSFTIAIAAPVLLGGALTFAMYREGKSKADSSRGASVSGAGQMASPIAPLAGAKAQDLTAKVEFAPVRNSPNVLFSHEVDFSHAAESDGWKTLSSPPGEPPKAEPVSQPIASPPVPSQASRKVKREKAPVQIDAQKTQPKSVVLAQSQGTASSAQPVVQVSTAVAPAFPLESANPPQEKIAPPDPAAERAKSATATEARAEGEPPSLYLDLGSFKDEIWANAAVEKLTQLGYHAVLQHKNLLWTHSFAVEVGPYTDPKDAEAARQSLAAQGFRAHPVK
jgi:class 3 adenylate cyclase/cell division septation protein DedD